MIYASDHYSLPDPPQLAFGLEPALIAAFLGPNGLFVNAGKTTQMSEEKAKIVVVTIRMPDGKEYEVPLPAKTFSSGREGFYSHIPSITYDDEIYGGQIQIWNKSKTPEKDE